MDYTCMVKLVTRNLRLIKLLNYHFFWLKAITVWENDLKKGKKKGRFVKSDQVSPKNNYLLT